MSVSAERPSLRDQITRVREDAIVSAVNRLLASKGYDQMTVDEVAAEVGIAKASLYKHFPSKEALAAAAMVRVLESTLAHIETTVSLDLPPRARLERLVRWTYTVQLQGEMPALPAANSTLRGVLMQDGRYLALLMRVSALLTGWIGEAQAQGVLDAGLPAEVVLYSLFARACDPVLPVLKATGRFKDAEIIDWLVRSCFHGLAGRLDSP